MPTINQLVRKPRQSKVVKSKSPALNVGYNSHKKVQTNVSSPQKRGVATRVGTMTQPPRTQRCSYPWWTCKRPSRGTLPHRPWCT